MGCCLNQMPNSYALAYKDRKDYQSILLKEKKASGPKKSVRFSFSYTNYNSLPVTEEFDEHHFDYIFSPDSIWIDHDSSEDVDIKYSVDDDKLKSQLMISFDRYIEHEAIISLVNNPRYRVLWDNETKKMEVIYGDPYLDATINLVDTHGKSKLWSRKVRRCNGDLFITYVPYSDQSKDSYLTIVLLDHKKIIIATVDNIECKNNNESIKRQIEWAKNLYYEVITNQSPIS